MWMAGVVWVMGGKWRKLYLNNNKLKNAWKKSGTFTQWNNTTLQKEELAPTICNGMNRSGEHFSTWNKPVGERQILYDFTYKWNLINKTSKEVKYTWRHWNRKKKLTVTRSEVGGDNGGKQRKGRQGTFIKDTWAKSKGRRIKGGRQRLLGWERVVGGKMETTILEEQETNIE